ncbi:MAG: GNAT family N-acetyltransferase [Sulfurospirillaceae bacterium]|nr:GNAT family N-acetyltransferase [Sulfurospirillaceae bacterium]MDD3463677.1 GNAT family N-acetyltransferase [Sulfurospirillaceae bacterium]
MIKPLRDALIDDLPEIVKIYNSAIADGISTEDSHEVSVDEKVAWFSSHDMPTRPLLVKEYHGKIIAWISFQPFYPNVFAYKDTARIHIYIEKNFQGKKLGQQFLCEALEKASLYGIETLLAFIFADNQASLKLFKKMGFKEWGNLSCVAKIEGVEKDLVLLGLKLKNNENN